MTRALAVAAATAAGAALAYCVILRRRPKRPSKLSGKTVRLTYLDAKASGEPIRLALFVAGIAFDDRRVTYSQIAALRDSGYLPFGQVPALEVDGVVFAQSQAILRWVGWHSGLYPEVRSNVVTSRPCIVM